MRFFDSMSIRNKLILSSIIFSLPIAVLLYFSEAGIQAEINSSELELLGNRYQMPLQHALGEFPKIVGGIVYGDSSKVNSAVAEIDRNFSELGDIHKEIGEKLQFTPEGLAMRDKGNLFYPDFMHRWNSVKTNLTPDSLEKINYIITDIMGMIRHGGDTSNLILDPDLDTYYLMDTTLLAIPYTIVKLSKITELGMGTQKNQAISKKTATALSVFAAELEENQTRIKNSIYTALNEDQNFYGMNPSMHQNIPPVYEQYASANRRLVSLLKSLADGETQTGLMNAVSSTSSALNKLWTTVDDEMNNLIKMRTSSYRSQMINSLLYTLIALIIAFITVWLNATSIIKSIRTIKNYAIKIDNGDLDAEVTDVLPQGILSLKKAISSMVKKLKLEKEKAHENVEKAEAAKIEVQRTLDESKKQQEFINDQKEELAKVGIKVNKLAEHLASSSEILSTSADEQARGAESQKEESEAVATAMEEMTSTVMEVAHNASSTAQAAAEGSESAKQGANLVQEAINSVKLVSTSAEQLESVLNTLEGRTEEIGRIISVINDIADQTNLLALNAAIEAARAGEAGRGFAVVADEVRKLAEKTMDATKEVETAIGHIQTGSIEAVKAMETTKVHVEKSSESSEEAGNALEAIMLNIDDMNIRISQIATAAEEQSAAAEEINARVEQINVIAGETSETAVDANRESSTLASLSQELLTLSMLFKEEKMDSTKLRHSNGEIRGILPKIYMGYIEKHYGDEVQHFVSENMGHPSFLPGQSYPDQILRQMADLVHEKTGEPQKKFFNQVGAASMENFKRMYRSYFKGDNLKELLLAMNDIHRNLTKDNPGLKPPKFEYEDLGKTLIMTYKSERDYGDYFVGIIHAAANYMGEKIKVESENLKKGVTKATIHFL